MHRTLLSLMLLLFAAVAGAAPAAGDAAPRTIRMEVNGLVCAFCAHGIRKALADHEAATDVYVNLEQRLVAVALAEGGDITDDALEAALTDAGYTVVRIERTAQPFDEVKAAAEAAGG